MSETRRYDSATRQAKTRHARMRILVAARDLFLVDGYVGTTLDAVAATAGVSPQTVYNLVGGKATLFKTVYDVTLAGDDEPIPIARRPDYRRIFEATTTREALTIAATVERTLFSRVGPLVALATAQAAAGDKDLRAFVDTIETERATGARMLVAHFAERFGLRPGLPLDRAAEMLWTLTGPHPAERLVVRCGWDWPTYEAWLVDIVHHALFGSR